MFSRKYLFAALGVVLLAGAALAAVTSPNQYTKPSTGTAIYTGYTVGTSHAQTLAAGQVTTYLDITNPAQTGGGTVWCAFGATAVVGAAGTKSWAPGQSFTWEGSFAPQDYIDCIASAASTPLTIGAQ